MVWTPPVNIPDLSQRQSYASQIYGTLSGVGDAFRQNRRDRVTDDQWSKDYARAIANDQRDQANADRNYELAQQRLAQSGQAAEGYYGTPIFRRGADGSVEAWQLGKDGQPHRVEFGADGQIMFPETTTDLGGAVRVGDKYGVNDPQYLPKTGDVGTDFTVTETGPNGEPAAVAPRPGSKPAMEMEQAQRENRAKQSKARLASASIERRGNLVNSKIDESIRLIGPYTTGWGGLLSGLPESEARTLKNNLDTIKANVGFGELQAMRDASPTGGALGQVSEMENRLLQAVNGALDQLANGEDIRQSLEDIKRIRTEIVVASRIAYMVDYEGLDMNTFNNALDAMAKGADPYAIIQRIEGAR